MKTCACQSDASQRGTSNEYPQYMLLFFFVFFLEISKILKYQSGYPSYLELCHGIKLMMPHISFKVPFFLSTFVFFKNSTLTVCVRITDYLKTDIRRT